MARGENVFRRKDGRYEARYIKGRKADGRPLYGYCYGKTYEEAKSKADIARNRLHFPEAPGQDGGRKLAVFCDNWLRAGSTRLKPSSLAKYHGDIENHIKPFFAGKGPGDINQDEVDAFTRALLHEKKLSPKTVRGILALLRSIFSYIEKDSGELRRGLEITYPKDYRKMVKTLDAKEEKALLRVLAREMDLEKFGVYLALRTGMRIGELCALRWCDISSEDETIYVAHTVQRLPRGIGQPEQPEAPGGKKDARTVLMMGTPKSGSSLRLIPLMPDIAALCSRFAPGASEAFVLTGTDKCMDPRKLQRRLKKYLQECQIGEAHFHTLRHTFATRCIEVGFDVKTLSELLGHSSIGITMNQYVHPNLALKRENMERLKTVITI